MRIITVWPWVPIRPSQKVHLIVENFLLRFCLGLFIFILCIPDLLLSLLLNLCPPFKLLLVILDDRPFTLREFYLLAVRVHNRLPLFPFLPFPIIKILANNPKKINGLPHVEHITILTGPIL